MNQNLKKILIKTKRQVFSEILGNNTSLLKGEGYDFLELKEYEYGEDVKNIDWIISAKMQKPYVKVYHAQKELNINIVPILGGSVYFGTTKFKQELICEIASILGFSCVKQGDPFSSYIANENLELLTKKTKKIFAVNTLSESIYHYNVIGKKVDYQRLSNELFKQVKKRSIIFIIGDFFDTEHLDLRILSKKHEVILIMVRDRFEEEPTLTGNVNLVDPSNGMTFDGVITQSTIKKYQAKLKENDHKLFEQLQKLGIRNIKIYTDEEPFSKIVRVLK